MQNAQLNRLDRAVPLPMTAVRSRAVKIRPVTPGQFTLCCAILMLGIFSFASNSYTYLRTLTDVLVAINIALCFLCVQELFETKALGKTLLVGSCIVFFWLDAVSLAHGPTAFAVPREIRGFNDTFDSHELQQALFSLCLFQVLLMAGYSLRMRLPKLANSFSKRTDSTLLGSRLLIYAFAAGSLVTIGVAYGFNVASMGMALIASRSGAGADWQDQGLWNNFAVLGLFGASRLLLDGLMSTRSRRLGQAAFGLAACSPFFLSGTRHLVMFVVLPVLAAGVIRMKKMTAGRALGLCAAGVLVFALLQLEFAARAKGWNNISEEVHPEDFVANSNGQFSALLFALHIVPAEHDFFHELAEPYFVIHWIPRVLWPGKPIMAAWAYYDAAYTRGGAFNVTPSVIGQFYMNWGFTGVAFIGLWLGILARLADLFIGAIDVDRQRSLLVTAGMLHAFIVASFRYYHPLYFTYVVFSIVMASMTTRRPKPLPNRGYGALPKPSVAALAPVH